MSDELIVNQEQVVVTPPETIVPTGEVKEVHVDETPDSARLNAEIERLKEVRKKAEEDAKYWRGEKAKARGDYFRSRGEEQIPPPVEPLPISQGTSVPRPEDFEDYAQYTRAVVAFEVNKAKTEWGNEAIKNQQRETETQKEQKQQDLIRAGIEKYGDFEDVAMTQTVPITPVIRDILLESEMGHDVAYYLGRNRPEAIQIARMTPTQAAKAIGKIELEITKIQAENPPQKRNISNAPPPINPLKQANPTIEPNPNEFKTQKEYEAWAESRKMRRF